MRTLLTFLSNVAHRGEHCCQRCAHYAHLKAHRRASSPHSHINLTTVTPTDSNTHDGNSSVSNEQFGNTLS